MNRSLCVVPVEKQSDRAFAESNGFLVESYVPRNHGLHVVRDGSAEINVAYYFLDPAGRFGPDVESEQVAWELATIAARARVDQWSSWARSRRIGVVTANFIPLAERPLFGSETADDAFDKDNALEVVDALAKRNADLVVRSNRLSDLKIRLEVEAKGLPSGREKNLELIKALVRKPQD